MKLSAIALLATVPLALGPLPGERPVLVVGLCNGGEIAIPFGDEEPDGPPCEAKACHTGNCREKIDRNQGRRRT